MSTSILAAVQMAPRDPILGVTEAFVADKNPNKINLGVGVYCDDNGKVPLLECVRRAERQQIEAAPPHGYLPIDGLQSYDRAVMELVFGAEAARSGRIITVQALGGTGGLKIGADFLRRLAPEAEVWISEPSWENHRALFENAGFKVNTYPYYEAKTRGLDFARMLGALERLPAGSIVVLHACCHNPTGVDLSREQWQQVLDAVKRRELVPFIDLAYQGFGDGIDAAVPGGERGHCPGDVVGEQGHEGVEVARFQRGGESAGDAPQYGRAPRMGRGPIAEPRDGRRPGAAVPGGYWAADLVAVPPGQFPVQHHDVVRGPDEVVEGVRPGEGGVHRHALLAQPAGHR